MRPPGRTLHRLAPLKAAGYVMSAGLAQVIAGSRLLIVSVVF